MKTRYIFLIVLSVIILISSSCLTFFFYFKLKSTKQLQTIVIDSKDIESLMEIPTTTESDTSTLEYSNPKIPTAKLDINWLDSAKQLSTKETQDLLSGIYPKYGEILKKYPLLLKQCQDDKKENCSLNENFKIQLYSVGFLKENNFSVYIIDVPPICISELGIFINRDLVFYDTDKNFLTRVITTDESTYFVPNPKYADFVSDSEYCPNDSNYKLEPFSLFGVTIKSSFQELLPPPEIDLPGQDKSGYLKLVGPKYLGFSDWQNIGEYGDFGLLKESEDGIKFVNQPVAFKDSLVGNVYFNGECYFIISKVGSIFVYDLQPSFLMSITPEEAEKEFYQDAYSLDVVWKDGIVEKDFFINGRYVSSCGTRLTPCTGVILDISSLTVDNLVEVAKTNSGGISIYELKNKFGNQLYWDLFLSSNKTVDGVFGMKNFDKEKLSNLGGLDEYTEFANGRPILFWKDFAGRWRRLQKTKYMQMAECGKPVIYLYPEKDTDVKVEVKPNGGFTKTEPMYDNGWFVRATPQSELFNYTDKTSYPYLFWEGKAYNFITPNYGFVMSKDEVGVKMPKILAKLGLNEKETMDFLEFWQPKLEVKPYVFVTFLPQREFDKLAPLTVNPKPDTVIRVFMDYTPLDAQVKVAPMQIRTPQRNGFTVVEWGGRLH